jgi:chloramphenicol-sensitive protein RarD
VGILQYINPSLQFICATLILVEPLTMWHAIAFPMIWIALVLYSVVSLYSRRA